MNFKISIGDKSHDGHGLYADYTVSTNAVSMDEIHEAYRKLNDLGISFRRDICGNYEDMELKPKHKDLIMKELGVDLSDVYTVDEYEGKVYMYFEDSSDYLEAFLRCLNAVNSKLECEIVFDKLPWFTDQIGYGMFS